MSSSYETQDLFSKPTAVGVGRVVLQVQGAVVSFKNRKILISKGPGGRPLPRPLMITKPELQQRMEAITESFVLQLLSAFRTSDGETLTGHSLRSAIALSMPADDCWTQIPEIHLKAELCEPGHEGATILIERL